jgi:hypothetical protein
VLWRSGVSSGENRVYSPSCSTRCMILRDESIHLNFGIDVINPIKIENLHLWTPAF